MSWITIAATSLGPSFGRSQISPWTQLQKRKREKCGIIVAKKHFHLFILISISDMFTTQRHSPAKSYQNRRHCPPQVEKETNRIILNVKMLGEAELETLKQWKSGPDWETEEKEVLIARRIMKYSLADEKNDYLGPFSDIQSSFVILRVAVLWNHILKLWNNSYVLLVEMNEESFSWRSWDRTWWCTHWYEKQGSRVLSDEKRGRYCQV